MDRERQLRSIRRLAAEQRPGATLLFGHDQEQMDRIVTEGLRSGVLSSGLLDDEVAVEWIGVDGLHLEIVDHHLATYTIPTTGDSVESVDLLIRAQFEKRPGQLILTIADVDGELALVGFHFNA